MEGILITSTCISLPAIALSKIWTAVSISPSFCAISSKTALSVAPRFAVTVPLQAAWTANVPALVTAWLATVKVPSTADWTALFVISISPNLVKILPVSSSILVSLVSWLSYTTLSTSILASIAVRLASIITWLADVEAPEAAGILTISICWCPAESTKNETPLAFALS